MAQQIINIGTTANDGTGDQLRDAFDKVNDNDTELYAADVAISAGSATVVSRTAPATLAGTAGDLAGQTALDADSLYVCVADYTDGLSDIWLQIDDTANDAHIADATIHFTQAAIDISESQINDLQAYVVGIAVPATAKGSSGDTAGMIASEAGYIYACHTTWTDGVADIWDRVATATWV